MHVTFTFETANCPLCGAPFARRCARCENEFFAPVVDRCRFCGLPPPWAAERRADVERADAQEWRERDGVNDPAKPLYRNGVGGAIWVIEGDIARIAVDAVVSNDDVDGQMWAQVSRAIKSTAGSDVERMAREKKPYKLGQAWLTKAGAMKLKGIIHVAAMGHHGEASEEIVRECLTNAFLIADKEGYQSLGVAAIGSGPASIDPERWLQIFADVSIKHLRRNVKPERNPRLSIVLVLFEPSDFEKTVRILRQAVWQSWISLPRRERWGKPYRIHESWWREMLGRPRWWLTAEKLTHTERLLAAASYTEIQKHDAKITQ
jgi:O-acetyl-ADP-ribose deacetylase (regulator of RNase III)